MPVTTPVSVAGPFTTNGVTTAFPFGFAVASGDEIAAVTVDADGLPSEITGYEVTLTDTGGLVTFDDAPLLDNPLYILPVPSFEQQTTFANQGKWSPQAMNKALDRAALRDIALLFQLDRAILTPIGESPKPLPPADVRAGGYQAFDPNGDPIIASGTGSDAGLRADLAATGGDALIKATAPSGLPTRLSRHIVRNYIDDISGVVEGAGGSASANAAAINAELALGRVYHVRPGSFYNIAKLKLASNAGLVFDLDQKNRPTFYMPASVFTRAENLFASRYGDNAVGIGVEGLTTGAYTPVVDTILAGFLLQSEVADNRSIAGIVGRNVVRMLVDSVEVFGLPLGVGANLQSAIDCELRNLYCHDFYSNTTVSALLANAPNATGILMGGDEVNGIACLSNRIILPKLFDIRTGPTFQAANNPTFPAQGDQSDGLNIAHKTVDGTLVDGAEIRNVGEGIDNFGCNGRFVAPRVTDAAIYAFKNIHGARGNRWIAPVAERAGLAFMLFSGSTQAGQDTEGNVVIGLDGAYLDPNGVHSASQSAGILFGDNGGTAGKPRNNSILGATIDPGPNGDYGYLDSSTGSRNFGINLDIRDRSQLQKKILVQNGAGAASVKGSNAWHTALDPSAIPVPVNASSPTAFPFVPSQFDFVILAKGSGARSIVLPPGWSGTIKDALGNAGAGTITISGAPSATGSGSFAVDADGQGTVTLTSVTGTLYEGMSVAGTSVSAGQTLGEWLTGTKGGVGTYRINRPQTLGATALSFGAAGTIDGAASVTITSNYGKVSVVWNGGASNGWSVV